MTLLVPITALLLTVTAGGESPAVPESPFELAEAATIRGEIDAVVFARLEELGIEAAHPASDAAFLRRVWLDVIGTQPSAEDARRFLDDEDPEKRARLIDELLEREEFADYQALRWGDLLRVKAEFPINLWPNAVQAYHRWIRTALAENRPVDRIAYELITASGSCFRVPPVNFYRAVQGSDPETLASAAALTFLGARLERWPEARRVGFTRFFSRVGFKGTAEWKEEIVFFDPALPVPSAPAILPDGTAVSLPPDHDPRVLFADWLIDPAHPRFAEVVTNRIWYWLVGRGIVHEPDDFRDDNPPRPPALLALLSRELIDSGFDLRHIYRTILNSSTYQLSCLPRSDDPRAAALFAYYPLRRLEAEVLIDALCRITGTTEEYSSAIPEPFTFIPEDQRSIRLADGSISSAFLEKFGRPPRDSGLAAERENGTTAAQRLHFLNSSHVRRKIEQSGKLRSILRGKGKPGKVATDLYLTILSRYPTRDELRVVNRYFRDDDVKAREGAIDLVWALFNSTEFLYRH